MIPLAPRRPRTINDYVRDRRRTELDDLRARCARLDRELDSVLALVHDRAPELIPAVLEVVQ